MEDNKIDERVVKETFHLVVIISLLNNLCHFVNVPEEIIRYVEHFDPCEVHY